jgi:hypothetical protein
MLNFIRKRYIEIKYIKKIVTALTVINKFTESSVAKVTTALLFTIPRRTRVWRLNRLNMLRTEK